MIELPRMVVVEKNSIKKIDEIVKKLKIEKGKILVVSGEKTFKIAGRQICDILGADYEIVRSSEISEVKRIAEKIKKEKICLTVACGGGKVIDVVKLASAECNAEYISVPTAASHDGLVSPLASIKMNRTSMSLKAKAPLAIVADLGIISEAPMRLTVSGLLDLVAKFSAIRDWRLANKVVKEEISEYSLKLALLSAKTALNIGKRIKSINNRKNEKYRIDTYKKIVKALIASSVAISIANSSRPASGSEHKIAHAIDIIKENKALHGEKVGIATVIALYMHRASWKKIKNFLRDIKAPIKVDDLIELGISREDIVKAVLKAKEVKPERYTIIEHTKITEEKAESIVKKVLT